LRWNVPPKEPRCFGSLSSDQAKLISTDVRNRARKESSPEFPITIENHFLGYRLIIYSNPLTWNGAFGVPMRFEYLPANGLLEVKLREENRRNCYRGSLRHFLESLASNRSAEEGYQILKQDIPIPGSSLLEPSSINGYFRMSATEKVSIHFQKQTSILQLAGSVDFSNTGRLLNSKSMMIQGPMATTDLGKSLPLEYKELKDIDNEIIDALGSIYESVYLHTDKPYYYPGEPIWFKAYMNYYDPELRNSISKLLYVELISPSKDILFRKQLALDSGFAANDFILPDTLKPGTYFLRSYTHSMRNFGEANLFVKQLPVLPKLDKVDYAIARKPVATHSKLIRIKADKELYKTREKIQLSIQTYDSIGVRIDASISISVTDAVQVVDVPVRDSIERLFPIHKERITGVNQISYPVETGITLTGHFLNNKGQAEKTKFDIIQWTMSIPQEGETNDQGYFWQSGFRFYDSASFLLKSHKANSEKYGKFELANAPAPTHYLQSDYQLPALFAGSVQRIVSPFEVPKGDSLLNVVQIKGKKINEEKNEKKVTSTYGPSDFVLAEKDMNLNYPNLLYAIAGKVPGTIVNIAEERIEFTRASGMSVKNQSSPMLMINDVPVSPGPDPDGRPGNAGRILAMIDPRTVKSIGFTKRLNVLYGTQGVHGVISIYTKDDFDEYAVPPNFQRVRLAGFNRERKLLFPDYSVTTENATADYRSTIYWNPKLKTGYEDGKVEVSFFSADLPGIYHVVVEGVNRDQQPIRADYYFEVESR
jgi:hypothetical protein